MATVQSTVEYTYTNEAETLELTFSVSYTMEEYHRQTWDEPASGGGPVDVGFELVSVCPIRDWTAAKNEIPRAKLNPRWVAKAEKDMQARYDAPGRAAERVDDAICEEQLSRHEDSRQ